MTSPQRRRREDGDGEFIDYWGEPYVSPTKERRDMRKNGTRRREELKSGPLFKSVQSVLFNVLRITPKTLMTMEFILLNLLAVGRILFNTLVAFMNPLDSLILDRSWPSINLFSGAIFIPKFNMGRAFPFWLRPIEVRRLEWNAIRILVSLSRGVHIAIDVEKLNMGFIFEEVVRDRMKHRSMAHLDGDAGFDTHTGKSVKGGHRPQTHHTPEHVRDASKKKHVKKKVEHFSVYFRTVMEKLKNFGINIAVNFDEVGVGVDFIKLELDGTITRSDEWWNQGTHIRALDVGVTMSTGKSASFLSWEVLELRFLEEDDSDYEESDMDDDKEEDDEDDNGEYFHLTPAQTSGNADDDNSSDDGAGADALSNAAGASAGNGSDNLARVQRDIARTLFEDGSEAGSTAGGAAGAGGSRGGMPLTRRERKAGPKDNFARALLEPPLLSLSSFSCGANVFLELAQMDFSSRSAMMSRYGEIKRLYRASNQYSASGPAGTSTSAHFARRKHQHIRGEMPNGEDKDEDEDGGAEAVVALGDGSRVWGMTMSAVAVSVFYAYAKAKAEIR